jgi:hypothetical protein
MKPLPLSLRYRRETERALARMLARASRPTPAARLVARMILRAVATPDAEYRRAA